VRCQVWKIESCDMAPYKRDLSHLAVVDAYDMQGKARRFFVHEHACQVAKVYVFVPGKRELLHDGLWMMDAEVK